MEKQLSNYIIYSDGKIYSLFTNRFLKFTKDKDGYYKVTLFFNKVRKDLRVHRVIAECFIDNVCNKLEVNHIDGNKDNNCVENLEWCTNTENIRHAIDNNLRFINSTKEEMILKNIISQHKRYSKMSDLEKETNGRIGSLNSAYGVNYMANKADYDKNLIAVKKRVTLYKNKDSHMSRAGNSVIIDGVEYKSILNASKELGFSFKYIKRRVMSTDYKNFNLKGECRHDS